MSKRFLVNPNTIFSGPDGRLTQEGFNQLKDLHDRVEEVYGDIPPETDLSTILQDIAGLQEDVTDLDGRVTNLENNSGGGGGSDLTWSSAINTTSGTNVEFTSLGAGASEIVLALNAVSTNGAEGLQLQLGTASAYATTGYSNAAGLIAGSGSGVTTLSSGFTLGGGNASIQWTGLITLRRPAGNLWFMTTTLYYVLDTAVLYAAGSVSLGAEATRLRLITTGTSTFDAGSFYVGYR